MSSATLPSQSQSNVNKQEWAPVAEKAKETAASVGELASKAASAVGAMTSQAACDVGSMASQAACDVGKKADDLTASAGIGIQGLGDRLSKSASQTGVLGSATQAVAKTVKDSGEYLEGAKFSGMTEDVAELIKKNPIPAVLIGIGLGWCAARALRS
ncbi:MAG: hypothetical protein IAG10_19580 [Planctomycetaceae bacterium]|nr:hypothetical protein [Planctomycetaceae bacterium]